MTTIFFIIICFLYFLWSPSRSQKLVGGEIEARRDDFYLLQGLDKAVMEENARLKENEKFVFLPYTIEATSQVVQGIIYRVEVDIAKSVCHNDKAHRFYRIEKCPLRAQVSGDKKANRHCRFMFWSRPWLKNDFMIILSANCTTLAHKPLQPGGIQNFTGILKDPYLLQGLDIALMHHNNEGIDGTGLIPANKYVYLPNTLSATLQGVEGKLFRAHVQIAPSICPNDDEHAYLRVEECSVQDINSPVIRRLIRKCEFEIWSRPWLPIPNALTAKKIKCVPLPVSSPKSDKIQPIMGLRI